MSFGLKEQIEIIVGTPRARIHKHMIHLKIEESQVLSSQLQPTPASHQSTLPPARGNVFKTSSGASREASSFGKSTMDIYIYICKGDTLFLSTGAYQMKIYLIFEVFFGLFV